MKIKRLLFTLFYLLIASCSTHYKASDFDTSSINKAAKIVLEEHSTSGNLHMETWPKLFVELGAKSVIVREDGVYILLSAFFVQESGLYIPSSGVKVNTGKGIDPNYKELDNNVYSYIIEG